MTDLDANDDTWEEFFGSSTELMPSIMGALDAIIENTKYKSSNNNTARKNYLVGSFSNNLSPYVQKVISNVSDDELTKKITSDDMLETKKFTCNRQSHLYRSMRSPEKQSMNNNHQSNESLDLISPNVQKMISNFPDAELVITSGRINHSFLHQSKSEVINCLTQSDQCTTRKFLCQIESSLSKKSECDKVYSASGSDSENNTTGLYLTNCKPLGSYLHTSPSGIASRIPVGRQNLGKLLQVPSESSVSTASSEVSRPVSLTSLGSCSSSGSSGPHQPSSAYLASAESLDSDPEPISSQGSADSGISEQLLISPETRVLQEVLETEAVYVSDLNEVIQGYLEAWKTDETDSSNPIKPYLNELFSNLEEIYNFNKLFLEQLRDADFDASKIANVFIQNDSGFIVYNEYCQNYPRTMNVLGELTRNEKMAPMFREKQNGLGHALPLGSYLLKPVQRILKYHLLLQRLSKQCSENHKSTVDLALTAMTSVASSINNMKRKHEHAVRVQEIQSQLYGWNGPDLTALGELIAEGIFRIRNAKGRRYVFLFDKILLMAKSKQDGALAYKTHIMCSNLMLVEQVRGEPLSFQILPFDNPRLQCTLMARSPHHKREWTLQIKRVILENYSAVIPNHARQLVMQLGQDVQDSTGTSDKWLPLKQSTPHYLERRSRVRKSRDLSGRRASSQDRTFPSIANWRRKSEPTYISQYDNRTVPKKISKLKKAKENCAKFYTDISDSENNEIVDESNESLEKDKIEEIIKEDNLEKIVSDLLMQNGNFRNAMNKQRKIKVNLNVNDDENNWSEDAKLPSKADSLPRSFQLNHIEESSCVQKDDVKKNESDLSFQSDYPEHKIYRKSAIRLSIVQRLRAIISEEQKRQPTLLTAATPVHKQGSKSMGEKIAHPDYADPQKLFPISSNSSRTNLTLDFSDLEPENLDMTINENEVLNEFDKRLKNNNNQNESSHGNGDGDDQKHKRIESSSQNSDTDSYYESELEKNLVEEYVQDESGKLIAKQDSFKITQNRYLMNASKINIKRPTKPPPPIPTKPKRLTTEKTTISKSKKSATITVDNNNESVVTKSWVKSMVGRFE